ncbi:hypothetical protein [Exercitatus varius]|uniref:hypothetical protein n=1 Tax=Exercitatus varius TaxID=67857 RepID=UPI00294B8CBD|nr:hypothetical protein [Exercitatus varius]MDG2944257.1 hypothetical protein [Exercitatus varius]
MNKPVRLFYSLNRAIEYLNNDLGYNTLKIEDLIHFIKKEKLTTVFQMEGVIQDKKAFLTSICEKETAERLEINNITLNYTINEYSESEVIGLGRWYTQYFINSFLKITFNHSLFDRNVKIFPSVRLKPIKQNSESLSMRGLRYITFEGYFQIDNSQYKWNDAEIVKRGYIEIDPSSFFTTRIPEPIKETTVLCFYIKNLTQPLKLDFNSIEISHSDLERFIGLQEKDEISALQNKIKQLKAELEEKQNVIDSISLTESKGRISSPQKQLFALLVKKCYPDLDSRNKVFEVINVDLKEAGIRNTVIKADTFYKLIDETADYTKIIFPPKKS